MVRNGAFRLTEDFIGNDEYDLLASDSGKLTL
jgi:hypothetical protein